MHICDLIMYILCIINVHLFTNTSIHISCYIATKFKWIPCTVTGIYVAKIKSVLILILILRKYIFEARMK